MSDTQDKSNAFAMWIPSLAISIVCCSVLFVVFADYLSDIKESISVNTSRIEMIERRTNQMRVDMVSLAKRLPPVAPSQSAADANAQTGATSGVVAPATAEPAAVPVPAEATPPASTSTPAVTAPVVSVPAVAAPPVQK